MRSFKYYFWRFIHNGIAHGLLMSVYEPKWARKFTTGLSVNGANPKRNKVMPENNNIREVCRRCIKRGTVDTSSYRMSSDSFPLCTHCWAELRAEILGYDPQSRRVEVPSKRDGPCYWQAKSRQY